MVTQVDEERPRLYYGGFMLVAVASCAVIARGGPASDRVVRPLLSWRPLACDRAHLLRPLPVPLPVFFWASPGRIGLDGNWLLVVRLAITFAIAIASYLLIEQPIRKRTSLPASARPGRGSLRSCLATVAVLFVSTAGYEPLSTMQANQRRLATRVHRTGRVDARAACRRRRRLPDPLDDRRRLRRARRPRASQSRRSTATCSAARASSMAGPPRPLRAPRGTRCSGPASTASILRSRS